MTVSGLSGATLTAGLNLASNGAVEASGTWCLPAQYFSAERFVGTEMVAPSATLTVCEGMKAFAGQAYKIPFTVNNPVEPQSSPNVTLSATSSQTTFVDGTVFPQLVVPAVTVEKFNQMLFGTPETRNLRPESWNPKPQTQPEPNLNPT